VLRHKKGTKINKKKAKAGQEGKKKSFTVRTIKKLKKPLYSSAK